MPHPRALGLDIGDKTCGVALSDPFGWTAQPVDTLRYSGTHDRKPLFEKLHQIIRENQVKVVVSGLPLNMNGTEGPQADKTRDFLTALKKYLTQKKIDVEGMEWVLWDERLSSTGAERSLLEADLSRAKRKKVIDKMAAVFILQGYLESQSQD